MKNIGINENLHNNADTLIPGMTETKMSIVS